MIRTFLIAVLAAAAGAQTPPAAVRGPYHFVQLMVREEPQNRLTVRSGGGTITFDVAGGYQLKARIGTNKDAAQPVERAGKYTVESPERLSMANPLDPSAMLSVSAGQDGAVLAGGSRTGPRTYELFVAARAGEAAPVLDGNWGGGYLAVADGASRGLITSFLDLRIEARAIQQMTAIGHAAAIDDVNRKETRPNLAYSMGAGGAGRMEVTGLDDTVLAGEKALLASGDGRLLLGFGSGAGRRDILVLVRTSADQGAAMFRGRYRIAELTAEGPYKYQPDAIRFGSAAGVAHAGGEGRALIVEAVRRGGGAVSLTTVNPYRIGSDGSAAFGPRIDQQTRNFAIGEEGSLFSGAEVDAEGRLTLGHGLIFGMRAATLYPYRPPSGLWWGAPMHTNYRPVDGATPAKPGETLIVMAAGTGPKAAVLFGGKPGEVKSAACLAGVIDVCQIHVGVPADAAQGPQVPVVIQSETALIDLFDIPIAR